MPEADDVLAGLGDWTPAELALTAKEDAGAGADEELPKTTRFKASIAKLLRRRRAQVSASADPSHSAVFLLHPSPMLESGKSLPRAPMLDNGLTAVSGRVWFVAEFAASGRYFSHDISDDDELFQLVTEQMQLGEVPAILYNPRVSPPEARYFPEGMGDPDVYESIHVADADVTLDRVFDVIDGVYRTSLVTPNVQDVKLWNDTDRWWPIPNVEKAIQAYIKAGLAGAFLTCFIRSEQSMAEGRLDLLIEERDAVNHGVITLHAVIELKVLRDFASTGRPTTPQETLAWMKSGVEQVAAYRSGRGARQAALCCFDMRRDDCGATWHEYIADLASRLSVRLGRWFLFSQAKLFRNSLMADSG